ncbi:MAG TPA: hypothetical protein VH496_13275 [Mycobacterium sp.]
MSKPVVIGVAVGAAGLLLALFGQGIATATPDVTGETYAVAKKQFSAEGLTPIIASRVGDRADEDNCTVARVQDANFTNGTGGTTSKTVYVHLNCYANVASSNSPGYSQHDPMGKKVQQNGSQGS